MEIRKTLGRFRRLLKFVLKVNWYRTLNLNLKNFDIAVAIKLPIICYGKLKILSLKGKINIYSSIKTGIVQIGKDIDNMPTSALPIKLKIDGILNFLGPCILSGGVNLAVDKDAMIEIGKFTRICSGVYLKATESIKVGDFTWITAESIVMDSDIHYVKNVESGIIRKNSAPITIGNNCWILMRSIISKGTFLPDYTILARNSYANKDYTTVGETGLFLAGSPARVIVASLQYIPSFEKEGMLNEFFKSNSDTDHYVDKKEFDDYSKYKHDDYKLFL